jgi:hypothetical protein
MLKYQRVGMLLPILTQATAMEQYGTVLDFP